MCSQTEYIEIFRAVIKDSVSEYFQRPGVVKVPVVRERFLNEDDCFYDVRLTGIDLEPWCGDYITEDLFRGL